MSKSILVFPLKKQLYNTLKSINCPLTPSKVCLFLSFQMDQKSAWETIFCGWFNMEWPIDSLCLMHEHAFNQRGNVVSGVWNWHVLKKLNRKKCMCELRSLVCSLKTGLFCVQLYLNNAFLRGVFSIGRPTYGFPHPLGHVPQTAGYWVCCCLGANFFYVYFSIERTIAQILLTNLFLLSLLDPAFIYSCGFTEMVGRQGIY